MICSLTFYQIKSFDFTMESISVETINYVFLPFFSLRELRKKTKFLINKWLRSLKKGTLYMANIKAVYRWDCNTLLLSYLIKYFAYLNKWIRIIRIKKIHCLLLIIVSPNNLMFYYKLYCTILIYIWFVNLWRSINISKFIKI